MVIQRFLLSQNDAPTTDESDPSLLPGDYAAALAPPQPWQPSDVIYVAALIGGIFGGLLGEHEDGKDQEAEKSEEAVRFEIDQGFRHVAQASD